MKTEAYPSTEVDNDQYEHFLKCIQQRFNVATADKTFLFQTDAGDLFPQFLAALPPERRQHYTCTSCRHFVERFGGLVVIDQSGETHSVMWDREAAPDFFKPAVRELQHRVERAAVVHVFLPGLRVWGEPVTGPWHHMAVRADAKLLRKPTPILNLWQMERQTIQEHQMLRAGLLDFNVGHVRKAKALLETDALYRSEKCLGVATWLLDLHEQLAKQASPRHRDNLLWRAVAGAPVGWCHVRSTMIGTLLEDLAAGKPYDDVARAFASKMHPLQYQRPTAQVSDGQIAAAEQVVAKLQSEGALARRFARLEDLELVWRPAPTREPVKQDGVFGHLRKDGRDDIVATGAPPKTMTWSKFEKDVLPRAERIELFVPFGRTNFLACVTAVNPDAPNMLQWDNRVSHYVYNGGSTAGQWNLQAGQYAEVTGVTLASHMWGGQRLANQKRSVTFVLKGARDTGHQRSGGMFPETMRSEYHAIRKVLERHFMQAAIEGKDEATACGICMSDGAQWNHRLRVQAGGVMVEYVLDRWD